MTINYKYVKNEKGAVTTVMKTGNGMVTSIRLENNDGEIWDDYQEWLKAGNTPDAAD